MVCQLEAQPIGADHLVEREGEVEDARRRSDYGDFGVVRVEAASCESRLRAVVVVRQAFARGEPASHGGRFGLNEAARPLARIEALHRLEVDSVAVALAEAGGEEAAHRHAPVGNAPQMV